MNDEIKIKLTSDDFQERRNGVELISKSEVTDELLDLLIPLIEDENHGVRDAVAQLLIDSDNASICKKVVPYISSKNISVRNLAGEILLKKGKPAISAMISYLKKANDDDQKFLIDIIGLIGDKTVEDDILKVLKFADNDNVILACIEALGNIKSEKSIDILKEKYTENELFHPTILEALGKIGTEDALKYINDKYKEADDLSKFAMIESLGEVGNEEIFYTLLLELRDLKGPLTWAVIEALAKLKDKLNLSIPFDESMKNTLVSVINEADDQYKIAASKLVADYQDDEILNVALKNFGRLPEFNENVKHKFFENPRLFYKHFIPVIQSSEYENQLFELFKEVVSSDNGEGLNELTEIEFRTLCDNFTIKLESPDEEVRRNAMELMFYLCYETALMFLDIMVRDSNVWNRAMLLEFLEQIEDESILPILKILTEDDEEMIKEKALEIISKFKNN